MGECQSKPNHRSSKGQSHAAYLLYKTILTYEKYHLRHPHLQLSYEDDSDDHRDQNATTNPYYADEYLCNLQKQAKDIIQKYPSVLSTKVMLRDILNKFDDDQDMSNNTNLSISTASTSASHCTSNEAGTELPRRVTAISQHFSKMYSLPLHWACYMGSHDMAKLFLQLYPDAVNSITCEESTPIFYASVQGHVDVIKLLLATHPSAARWNNPCSHPSLYFKGGGLPLHAAARQGHIHVAQVLLESYPEGSTTKNNYGEIPLFGAIWNGHLDMTRLLLDHCPLSARMKDNGGDLALHKATKKGFAEVVDILLELYPEGGTIRDKNGKLPIYFASKRGGNVETVRMILNRTGFYGLFEPGTYDDLMNNNDFKQLWRKGQTPITRIWNNFGSYETSQILKEAKDFPILHEAIGAIPISGIYYIINRVQVDLTTHDANGHTALSVAIQKSAEHITLWKDYYHLIIKVITNRLKEDSKRKNVDDRIVVDKKDATKSHSDEDDSSLEISRPLHSSISIHSCCLGMVDDDGRHALHTAIELGVSWDGIKLILDRDINALSMEDSSSGLLPFMMAACASSRSKSDNTEGNLTATYELLLAKPDLLINV